MKLILVFLLSATCTLGSSLSIPDLSPLFKVKEVTVPIKSIPDDDNSHIQVIPPKKKTAEPATPSRVLEGRGPSDPYAEGDEFTENHKVRVKRKPPSKAEIARLRKMKDSFDDLKQLKDERPDIQTDFDELKNLKNERPDIQTNFDEFKKLKDERPGTSTNIEDFKPELPNAGSDISGIPKEIYKRKAPSKAEIARLRGMKDSFDDLKKLKDERPDIQTNFDDLRKLKDERPRTSTNLEDFKPELPNVGSDISDIPKGIYKRKAPSKAEIARLRGMKDSFDDLKKLKDERPELPDIQTDFDELKNVKDERPDIQTNFDDFKKLKDERLEASTNLEDFKPELPNIGSDISDIPKGVYKRKAPSKAEIARLRGMKDSFDDLKKLKDERPDLPDIKTDFDELKNVKDERPDIKTNFDDLKKLKDERPEASTNLEDFKPELPNIGSDISDIPKGIYKRKAPSKAEIARLRGMKDSFDDLKKLKDERPELPDIKTDFDELKNVKDERPDIQTNFDELKKLKDERPGTSTNPEDFKPVLPNVGSDISGIPKGIYKREAPSKVVTSASNKPDLSPLSILREDKPEVPKIHVGTDDTTHVHKVRVDRSASNKPDLSPLSILREDKPKVPEINVGTDDTTHVHKVRVDRSASNKPDLSPISILREDKPKVPEIHVGTDDTTHVHKVRVDRSASNKPDLSPLSILREDKPKVPEIHVGTDDTTHVHKIRVDRSASNKPDLSPLSIIENDGEMFKMKKVSSKKRSYEQNELDDPINEWNEIIPETTSDDFKYADAFAGESHYNELFDKIVTTEKAADPTKLNALAIEASRNKIFDAQQPDKISLGFPVARASDAASQVHTDREAVTKSPPAVIKNLPGISANKSAGYNKSGSESQVKKASTAKGADDIKASGRVFKGIQKSQTGTNTAKTTEHKKPTTRKGRVTGKGKPKNTNAVKISTTKSGKQKSRVVPKSAKAGKTKKSTKRRNRVPGKTNISKGKQKRAENFENTTKGASKKGTCAPKTFNFLFAMGPEGVYIGSPNSESTNDPNCMPRVEPNDIEPGRSKMIGLPLSIREDKAAEYLDRFVKILSTALIGALEDNLSL